jgi:hypothetical protein
VEDILTMSQTITVVLGGRDFTVRQLPIRRDAAWRESVKPLVDPIAEMTMAAGLANPTPDKMVRLAFASALFVEPMTVLAAVCDYAPELAAERTWLEENAFADEALQALLTLFFGMRAIQSPGNGAARRQPTTTAPS